MGSSAVTPSGAASATHHVAMIAATPSMRRASSGNPGIGIRTIPKKSPNPRKSPMRVRVKARGSMR